MRLLRFSPPDRPGDWRLGALVGDLVFDLDVACRDRTTSTAGVRHAEGSDVQTLIEAGPAAWDELWALVGRLVADSSRRVHDGGDGLRVWPYDQVSVGPPIPRPTSVRDFYAFERHVAAANRIRGRSVPEPWYRFPVFYFSNHNAIRGPGEAIAQPAASRALDYELEVACVIGKAGCDIRPDQAEAHIFGFTILNDWSARDLQREEMAVGLGPAKGKDFATSLGPCLVTPDELAPWHTGRPGVYDLAMVARVNGVERSRGNWRDLHYSFGDMIARASADTRLLPGDVLGSGTVGTGCLLELTEGRGPWLQPGDVVELEIERLGVLRNTVDASQG